MWLGIPEYRLDRGVLASDIQAILDLGVDVEYETRLALDDTLGLHKEADELWEKFVVEVERGGFKTAVISAYAPDTFGKSAAAVPFDTVYEKIGGAWRTRLVAGHDTAPLNKAAIHEILDRQVAAIRHRNFSATVLFTAADWVGTIADADAPDMVTETLTIDQVMTVARDVYGNASTIKVDYEILDIAIDRKAGTARVVSRVTEKVTINGLVIDSIARTTDFMETRDGVLVWTRSNMVMERLEQYPVGAGRPT